MAATEQTKNKANNRTGGKSLQDLRSLTGSIDTRERRRPQNQPNNAYERRNPNQHQLFQDGIDHINIWNRGRTDLGRILSMEHEHHLDVPVYGKFNSVFALWTFLTTKGHPNDLRFMPEHMLRGWIKTRKELGLEIEYPHIKFICVDALAEIILRDHSIVEALIENKDTTLASYIVMPDYNMTHPNAEWWVAAVRLIRAQLVAEEEVNLGAFAVGLDSPEGAYVPLVQAPMLGQLKRAKPVKEKKPKVKKEVQANVVDSTQAETETRTKGVRGTYTTAEDFDMKPWEKVFTLGFVSHSERQIGINTIVKSNPEEWTELVTSLKEGIVNNVNPSDGPSAEDTYAFLLTVHVNENTGLLMGVSTGNFDNPLGESYGKGDKSPVVIEDESSVMQTIRDELNICDSIPDGAILRHKVRTSLSSTDVTEGTVDIGERQPCVLNELNPETSGDITDMGKSDDTQVTQEEDRPTMADVRTGVGEGPAVWQGTALFDSVATVYTPEPGAN